MGNEEAIEMLEALLDPDTYDTKLSKRAEEAVKVAIKALEEYMNDPCTDCHDNDICYICPECGRPDPRLCGRR